MALKTGTLKIVQASGSKITVDTEMSSTSTNPVQNKVIYEWVMKMFQGLDPVGSFHEFTNEQVAITLREGYWELSMTGGGGANSKAYSEPPSGFPNTSTAGSGAAFLGVIYVKQNGVYTGLAGGIGEDSTIFGITCGAGQDATNKRGGLGGVYDQGTQPASVEIYGTPLIAGDGNTGLWRSNTSPLNGANSKLTSTYDAGEKPEYGQGRGRGSYNNPPEDTYMAGAGYIKLKFLGLNPPS